MKSWQMPAFFIHPVYYAIIKKGHTQKRMAFYYLDNIS